MQILFHKLPESTISAKSVGRFRCFQAHVCFVLTGEEWPVSGGGEKSEWQTCGRSLRGGKTEVPGRSSIGPLVVLGCRQ